MRISLKLCYIRPSDIRNGTLETCSKRTDTHACVLVSIEQSLSVYSFIGYPSEIRKHEITSIERILLYINMRILKLSIGNAVLQERHMSYIAVSAGLIHTTRFHLPRTLATVLNQGLGYGFNIKIRLFMKIMNSLCPPSKKMVHIALCICMSVGWSVYLDSRFPTTCETYNKDRLTP